MFGDLLEKGLIRIVQIGGHAVEMHVYVTNSPQVLTSLFLQVLELIDYVGPSAIWDSEHFGKKGRDSLQIIWPVGKHLLVPPFQGVFALHGRRCIPQTLARVTPLGLLIALRGHIYS